MTHTNLNFSFTLLDGSLFCLPTSDQKVVLVVNTASKCGFAKQFKALQLLHEQYYDQGFTVLGVSSQSFGKQELDRPCLIASSIKQQAPLITFPITQLVAVRGQDSHPFYAWAAAQVSFLGRPKWNFHKYLLGKNGQLLTWFASITDPLSEKISKAIHAALRA